MEDRLGTRARVFGTERAILAGIDAGSDGSADASMRELESLAETAGIPALASVLQRRQRPVSGTFLGKGKIEEVRRAADELGADVVIFNDELTPAQARNLEEALSRKVVDRTQLILDIFAQRASTKEARLQVELAQLRYLLPRLRGWGMALTRTGGGIGTRGPGETQLDLDRFKVNRRIHALEARLRKTAEERSVRSKKRRGGVVPQIALVGYTNSGKSTLLNRLCDADSVVEDKLFATLDTRVRRGPLPSGRFALFVDTVGFIRDLPHDLVPAFAATLEAVRHADLILHIVDRSRTSWEEDDRVVLEILEQEVLRDDDRRPPMIAVLNKVDAVPEAWADDGRGVPISAASGRNVDSLLRSISEVLFPGERERTLLVPFDAVGDFYGRTPPERVEVIEHTETGIRVRATVSDEELRDLRILGVEISASAASPDERP